MDIRSLAGYSPWGHEESDMTEQLTLALWCFFMRYLDKRRVLFFTLKSYIIRILALKMQMIEKCEECYDLWGRKELDTTEQLNWTEGQMSSFVCPLPPLLFSSPIPIPTLAVWQKIKRFFLITLKQLCHPRLLKVRSWSSIYSVEAHVALREHRICISLCEYKKPFAKMQTWAVPHGSHLQGVPELLLSIYLSANVNF